MRPSTIKSFALGVITGSFVTAGGILAAAPAKAEPDSMAYAYAATFSGAVCSTLDDYPSFDGIIGIASAIEDDGLSAYQAGEVIGLSIAQVCPRHTRLMVQFISRYGDTEAVA